MALYFFVLLTLLKLALCLPDPNVKVDIDVDVDVDDKGCGPGGIPCNQKSCSFGGTGWPSGCILTEACFKLKCEDGTWKYTGEFDHGCGNCTFGGEPLIYTFDTLNNSRPIITQNNLTGEYIMTQPGLKEPAEFGVHGHFTDDPNDACYWYTTCINGVTYYEAGITITITLTDDGYGNKIIKVFVDEKPFTIGPSVEYVYGTSGAILVFEHANIDGGGLKCISVIGTKGLTVALCETSTSAPYLDPWAYIYAMPALESNPDSQLYGLCNTWTGDNQDCFTEQDGTCVPNWECNPNRPNPHRYRTLCDKVADTWKTSTPSVETTPASGSGK